MSTEKDVPLTRCNEENYRLMYLSRDSIEEATSFVCESMRNSLRCPNNGLCLNQFTRTQGPVVIKELRSRFWKEGGSPSYRKDRLREVLSSFLVLDSHQQRNLHYQINGTAVCKSFFKSASGIPTKMFDAAVAFVTESQTNVGAASFGEPVARVTQESIHVQQVCAFLDNMFRGNTAHGRVESLPNGSKEARGTRTIDMKWAVLYEDHYKPHCELLGWDPVLMNQFTQIRREHRYCIRTLL
jgi:hypothetical protein